MKSSVALLLATLLLGVPALAEPSAQHDRAFWEALKAQHFKLPPGASAAALARETLGFLPSTDGALRDGIGYEAFETWVYHDELLTAAELEALRVALLPAARAGLGDPEGDGVFGRSFALLDLSVLAAEDLRRPFLTAAARAELLDLALTALARERDLRGYVAGKGWAHATAHAADLTKFLARSPQLPAAEAERIVPQVAARLRSAPQVFVWGEDARLAEALLAVTARADFRARPFEVWVGRLRTEYAALWSAPFDPGRFPSVQAQLNGLAQLAARLPEDDNNAARVRVRTLLHALVGST